MTPRALTATVAQPQRIVRLSSGSADYYDAASSPRDVDFGPQRSPLGDDYLFTGEIRRVTIARLRREAVNNPYLCGLVTKYPEAVGHTSLRSRTSSREYNLAKELFWYRLTKRITIEGRSLRKAERIVLSELLVAGEIFVVLLASGRIQLIASEYCGSPGGSNRFAPNELNGIVTDPTSGQPIAYRFGRMTPWGTVEFRGTPDELVPARNVIHVFDSDRVVQGRGRPWLLASIRTARDLYEITRSKTKQIKDVNSISGFIEKQGSAEFLGNLSTGLQSSLSDSGSTSPETGDSPADPKPAGPTTVELAPGTFIALEPGEKVNTLMSEYKATDYKELIMLMLHAISTPVGLPVELWFSGLGDVNYSGFKGLGVQWASRRRYVQEFLEENFLDRLQFWRISKAAKEGDLPPNPDADDDKIAWGWKRAAVLDDEKAAKANQVRLQTGEISLADVWEENGSFSEEVLEGRRQLWIKLQVAAGLLDPADAKAVAAIRVPLAFLLRSELPGSQPPAAAAQAASPASEDTPPAAAPTASKTTPEDSDHEPDSDDQPE